MAPPPARLSREMRLETDPDLRRRRWMVGLSLIGTAIGQVVSLYQFGMLRRLPDPPVDVFDSERVNASDYAYARLQTPDAFLMTITYGLTAALAAAGGRTRAERNPAIPVALTLKAAFDVATNLRLAREEWRDNQALCAYCQTASLISMATLALSLPETLRAVRGAT
ncbi:vitamin K epoxide reductase family protein [Roseomonas sp. CCTCC AB2023176]|uniref:vitamin K epoxide reductase family protein n=1 Tax=Roseomonas sp. CCTCC AB2023176 TaxID=3342640 RepID=UPI0035E1A1CB